MHQVLISFAYRFIGTLQDWWIELGEYRQLQFLQMPNVESALRLVFLEFYGQDEQSTERFRSEFFKLKCCSMKKKDLETYFANVTNYN